MPAERTPSHDHIEDPELPIEQLILTAIERAGAGEQWKVMAPPDNTSWVYAHPSGVEMPQAGWKLHVSATQWSAEKVLARTLPVLIAAGVPFKCASSIKELVALNYGEGGIRQIGKFVTVYPLDDAQAVRVASSLADATDGLRGPRVPSDKPLSEGSLVHYRYAEYFAPEKEASAKTKKLDQPEVDPFVAAGVATEQESELIGGMYLPTTVLHRSTRGPVILCVDVFAGEQRVLKQAWRDVRVRPDGSDARDQLRHEYEVLTSLGEDERWPRAYPLVEHRDDLFLPLEFLPGETLARRIDSLYRKAEDMELEEIVFRARQLTSLLSSLHKKDMVYRDINSVNVIVRPNDEICLCDFEFACEIGTTVPYFAMGTPGYVSPEQSKGEEAAVTDDVYGMGGLLYFMATGEEPGAAGEIDRLLYRLGLFNAGAADVLEPLISGCLAPDPGARWPSVAALDARLAAIA